MLFGVLFDANVLGPIEMCDLALSIADREIYKPYWSDDILTEVRRFCASKNYSEIAINARINFMHSTFPDSQISNYQGLIEEVNCHDPHDRHVLAAAIVGKVNALVTFNLKDFPSDIEDKYGIELIHPDEFFVLQFDLNPEAVMHAIVRIIAKRNNPVITLDEYLAYIAKNLPKFAEILLRRKRDLAFHRTIFESQ